MKVYLVQHKIENGYNYIVDVVGSEEKAKMICREYNKDYAYNVGLDETGLFTGKIVDEINYNYYDYFVMKVN